ncbi:MAG: Serine phosphatase RsbU, regulator of sigma subunit [uncultured Aureispira sp.]|uniref:Serine phosphatase RsbU, regulator of sigma subunit n=1 Tax=uncultured Aureispira sp. TaxID=1331704 RepID=A0A6S6SIL3_9BACT|nr:MAG: Serine phosphatase RsbU, regulator of sigma subunit [uncultured Aureispira sp.]
MGKIHSKKIVIKNTIKEVQRAISAFETFASQYTIPNTIMVKVNVVLDELLSNIVKYSFPDGQEYEIDITIELFTTGKLIIQLTDAGIPFNPFETPEPDISIPLEDREVGGLGILLVKKLMDGYSYKRQVNLNVTSMVKNNC